MWRRRQSRPMSRIAIWGTDCCPSAAARSGRCRVLRFPEEEVEGGQGNDKSREDDTTPCPVPQTSKNGPAPRRRRTHSLFSGYQSNASNISHSELYFYCTPGATSFWKSIIWRCLNCPPFPAATVPYARGLRVKIYITPQFATTENVIIYMGLNALQPQSDAFLNLIPLKAFANH